jgi:hypothetical protein
LPEPLSVPAPEAVGPAGEPEPTTPAPRPEDAVLEAGRAAAAAEAAQDEAARDAAREALDRERTRLIEALRRDAAAADRVLDRLLFSPPEEALALARVLRHVPDTALGRRLAATLTSSPEPHRRRAAIHALEGREGSLWVDPVTRAFRGDSDDRVREDAGRVLSHSLRDLTYAAYHGGVREALLAGLDDPDPRQRARAAEAFAIDREAPAGVRERLAELAASDPDPVARAAAASASRALR